MIATPEAALGILINILPYFALALAPFKDNYRLPRRILTIVVTVIAVCQVCTTLFLPSPFPSMDTWRMVHSFFYLIIYAICYFSAVRASVTKLLFVLIIVKNYADFVSPVAKFLELYFFPDNASASYQLEFSFIQLALLIPTFPLVWYLMTKRVKPVLKLPLKKEWRFLWLIPAMFWLFYIVFTNGLKLKIISQLQLVVLIFLISVGSFVVYFAVLQMLIQTAKSAALEENTRMMERQLTLEREHYSDLTEYIGQVKAARHDLRHHLKLIQAYIDTGDNEKLKEYIEQYRAAVPDDTTTQLCLNYTVDTLVRYYAELAKDLNIDVQTHLNLPETMAIADSDLCIVFGNLLENAVDACKRQTSEQRFIKIKAMMNGQKIIIAVDNSYEGEIRKEGEGFLSSKREGRGIGITSVEAVVNKYRGQAKFEYKEHVFMASIILQMQ